MLSGLTTVNVELTSRCNKNCWMCGRRKIEREYPEIEWGDMDYEFVKKISTQIPERIVVQFHNNGEPLLYPRLGEALSLFSHTIRCFDTNGKLLLDQADEIIGNLETITISTFEGDGEADEQYEILRDFLRIKGDEKPNVIVRLLGNVSEKKYKELGITMYAKRVLHSPMGSFGYQKTPTVSEIGICLDFLNHLSIDRYGFVSPCVRFDPNHELVIGDVNTTPLEKIWNGAIRQMYKELHIRGERWKIPLCRKCEFWGVATG